MCCRISDRSNSIRLAKAHLLNANGKTHGSPVRRAGETPAHKKAGIAVLQQLDRSDLQRIALDVSGYVHAKMIFLVRRLKGLDDLCVALGIEFQELFVLRHNTKTTRWALYYSAQARGWERGSAATFLEQLTSTTGT
jgi:hypothetical protein